MSRGRIFLLGWILVLGLSSCSPGESPASLSEAAATVTHHRPPTETSSPRTPTETASPSPTSTATLSPTASICREQAGRVVDEHLEATAWPEGVHYRIYLPPCYEQTEKRYPALYLLHGQTYDQSQWDQWGRLGLEQAANELISNDEIPLVLIVMPREIDAFSLPENSSFAEILLESVIPHVEATYRTQPERAYRAIGGISRGGNWAIHVGLSNWELFTSIGAHSAPVFFSDKPEKIRTWLGQIPEGEYPRIYLDSSQGDPYLERNLRFETILVEEGIPHEWHLSPGFHNEDYWAAHVETYLRWYTAIW